MKTLGTLVLAILLAACVEGTKTSSSGGAESTFETSSSAGQNSVPSQGGGSAGVSETEGSSGTTVPGGTYVGELNATLSGDGIVPVSDSTELVIEIAGSQVTATAEDHSYLGSLEGTAFSVKIPIDEESHGIVCRGTPMLEGTVDGNTASGTVSGEGECSSNTTTVPVSVDGTFVVRK